jgi:hypothetical protein
MKFGNEFWLILFQDYISPKLFAVQQPTLPLAGHVCSTAACAVFGRVCPTAAYAAYGRPRPIAAFAASGLVCSTADRVFSSCVFPSVSVLWQPVLPLDLSSLCCPWTCMCLF